MGNGNERERASIQVTKGHGRSRLYVHSLLLLPDSLTEPLLPITDSLTNRLGVELEQLESRVKISVQDPEPLRTAGDLVHFENVEFRWPGTPKSEGPILEGVKFTLGQAGRIAFVGAVSTFSFLSWVSGKGNC